MSQAWWDRQRDAVGEQWIDLVPFLLLSKLSVQLFLNWVLFMLDQPFSSVDRSMQSVMLNKAFGETESLITMVCEVWAELHDSPEVLCKRESLLMSQKFLHPVEEAYILQANKSH